MVLTKNWLSVFLVRFPDILCTIRNFNDVLTEQPEYARLTWLLKHYIGLFLSCFPYFKLVIHATGSICTITAVSASLNSCTFSP